MKFQIIKCPLCGFPVEIDMEWAAKNGRVFCCTCCKSFDVGVKKQEPEYGSEVED